MNKYNLSIAVLFALTSYVASTCDLSTGICYSAGITCPSSVSAITVNGKTYYLSDLDVISFNDLTINNGDIQKRAAVRNNFYATNGVSVGDMLTDGCGFGLIVGGDLVWAQDGAVFPTNQTFFVGGQVTGPSYIINQVASCDTFGQTSGCISSYFDDLYAYWSQFSSSLSILSDNVDISYSNGIATLACNATANEYNIHIASSDFNQIIGYATTNCATDANWVFNLYGDVSFNGNPFDVSGSVVFNIGGSGAVTVTSSVIGSIIAPSANINMVGGTIYGKVIAGNFSNVIQINSPNTCPTSRVASRDVSSCAGSASGSASGSVTGSASGSASSSSSSGSNSGTVGDSTGDATVPSTTGVETIGSNSGDSVNGQPSANNNNQDSGVSALAASFIVSLIAVAFI